MKHAKFIILALLTPLFLGLTACDPDEKKTVEPTVTITAGEATGTSLTFSIETKDATRAAWVVVPASAEVPSATDILAQGSSIRVNQLETITAPNLTPMTTYTVAAAAEGNGATKVNTITMSTSEKGFTLQLQITLGEIEHDEAAYVVTATEQNSPYFMQVVERSKLEGKTEDEIYRDFIVMWEEIANEEGCSIFESLDDAELIFRGNQEGRFTGLTPSTAYTVIAFGFDENNARTSEFVQADFETIEHEFPLTINIELGEPKPNSVPITLTVNDESLTYVVQAVAAEPIADMDDETLFNTYMDAWAEYAVEYDMDLYEFLGASQLLMKGNIEGEFQGLTAETDYTIIAWGLNTECEQISEIHRVNFSTPATPKTDLTFEMTVDNITETTAHFRIVPSDLNATFVWLAQPITDPNQTAEDIMNDYVSQWGGFLNSGMGLYSGIQDYTSKSMIPNTDYYFLVFGYDGGITTEPIMQTFSTPAGADASAFDCTFTISRVDAHNAQVIVTPNHNSIYYLFGAVPDGELDIEQTKTWMEEDIATSYQDYLYYNPGTSLADYINSICYNGEVYGNFSDLEEETSYTVFAFPITPEGLTNDVHVIVESCFTTPAFKISDAWMTSEYHKVFDGDEVTERGLFDGADCTGRGIMTMAFDASDNAAQIFHTIPEGDFTDTEEYSDEYLWNNAVWIELTGGIGNNPYGYYLIDWSYTYTVLTVAKDADGYFGPVHRTLVTPRKGDISPIEELVEMIEASSASRHYCVAPEEITVENDMPTFTEKAQISTRVKGIVTK